jgi:hypothetical protein
MAGALGFLIAVLLTATPLFGVVGTHVVTVTHEGGHALVGSLTGGQVRSVRVQRDGGGETLSSGSRRVPTALAGYLTPPAVGLAALALAHGEHGAVAIGVMLVALVFVVLLIRNLFGLIAVVAIGAFLYGVLHDADPGVQTLVVTALGWTLLLASVRDGLTGMSGGTGDARHLAKTTHVHWLFWQTLFALAASAAALYAVWLALYRW